MKCIILSAGNPESNLQNIFGNTSSSMYPISGRPSIQWLMNYLLEIKIKEIIIAIRKDDKKIKNFLNRFYSKVFDLSIVEIIEDRGPAYSLYKCLDFVKGEDCLIVLGDTIFSFEDKNILYSKHSFVLYAMVNETHRWCIADCNADDYVIKLIDKRQNDIQGAAKALIGVYYLTSVDDAQSALTKKILSNAEKIEISEALLPYIQKKELKAFKAGKWLDCGHIDKFIDARRHIISTRAFNNIEIDDLRGTITKRSSNKEKLVNEINYYRLLPKDLSVFFPRLIDYSIQFDDLFFTLEYYSYITLSELFVFENLEPSLWNKIFNKIHEILSCFKKYSIRSNSSECFDFYWGKTLSRINAFAAQSQEMNNLVSRDYIVINGYKYCGWPLIKDKIKNLICEKMINESFHIIHGDLCFANILYDPMSGIIKFIDPRGSFGSVGIYGDPRYDIAKLLHSIDGCYDFIINDMYNLNVDSNGISFDFYIPENYKQIFDEFCNVFFEYYNINEVQIIEALLFLSMCSLHYDKPERQLIMWSTGIKKINEVLNENSN